VPLAEAERRAARVALEAAAADDGLALPDAAVGPLADYLALLVRWRRRRRIAGPSDLQQLAVEVVLDALQVDPLVPTAGRLFDVGSGAGFPGLPLAVLGPARRLSLVEPAAARAALLRLAVATLDLEARVLAEPVDRVAAAIVAGDEPPADAAIARAFLPPDEWLAVARPLVRPGGTIVVLAGADWPGPRDGPGLVPAGRVDYVLRGRRPRRAWAFRRAAD
jgi:16S rRNA (guanine527-N7)-methyltransferase